MTSNLQCVSAMRVAGMGLEHSLWCSACRVCPSDAAEAALQPGDAAVGGIEATYSKDASQEDGSVLFELD